MFWCTVSNFISKHRNPTDSTHLCFSTSSMDSGSRTPRVSGSSRASRLQATGIKLMMICGRGGHTSSSSRMRGAMATPTRDMELLYPRAFCLATQKRRRLVRRQTMRRNTRGNEAAPDDCWVDLGCVQEDGGEGGF